MKSVDVVKETIKMHQWILKHPEKEKRDYLKTIPKKDWPKGGAICYLCDVWSKGCGEEMGFGGKDYNSDCPLDTRSLHCDDAKDSPYHQFEGGANIKKGHQRIIRACQRWLKKYGEV